MTTPITLNVRDVALAAKAAYDEKRLSAQTTRNIDVCFYRDRRGAPCGIGAALPDDVAREFDERMGSADLGADIAAIVNDGLVETDDLGALIDIQTAHDNWATARGRAGRMRSRKRFLAMLNAILADRSEAVGEGKLRDEQTSKAEQAQ